MKIHVGGEIPVQGCRGRVRVIRRAIEGRIEYVLNRDLAPFAECRVGCRGADPVKETEKEAKLLYNGRASDPGVFRVAALESGLQELHAENASRWGPIG